MIVVPISTIEKPLTVIDYIAQLARARSVSDIQTYAEQLPAHIRDDDRFTRAVRDTLERLRAKKAAA